MSPSISEETPLLQSKHEEVYKRFKPAQKRLILAIVSVTGLLPLFVAGTFIPSIPQIAKDLDSSGAIVSLAVSLSILASSIGSLLGASYSTFYGRKPIYLVGTPLLFAGSIGVAASQSIPQLMIWRFIQALGSSPGLAVGSGTIGDIYKLEERGQALGIFFAAVLLGPALAPLAGGFATHYFSWRLMQIWLGQRGVDKADPLSLPNWRPVILNPLSSLWLLRSPNLLFVTLAGFATLQTDYVLLVPLAYTIGVKYNITNAALIGACFLPCGLGNMSRNAIYDVPWTTIYHPLLPVTVGAPLAGRFSDKIVIYYRKKRGGEWYPEDRLRGTFIGALFLIPFSVAAVGLLTEYVPGKLGLSLNLICLFLNGLGVDFVLSPSAAYCVDLMHSRSAEAMAANNGSRSVVMALAIAGIIPMIDKYGVVITNLLSAFVALMGFFLLWATIRYGERLRAVVNVGFSTADNN
ncbi:hypothetical protein GALMADRAFT_135523 [Galerina marginata CBS 339.88]|uniref:Major facilitator superfamily (MFS) profile domain-containing protein n=1 Tax=Galerina marginata (strain CBS 339.88) TaxID=685588 RepID=A0A067TG16_GALM3|nr:hypothetical protein GALMADRAFT_135523 [Galerina marginata CBS 339.88]